MSGRSGERYSNLRALGESGRTWVAGDAVLHREVVLRDLPLPSHDAWLVRNEVQRAARLVHPNAVAVLDVLDSEDGVRVVTEHVPGPSLAERMEALGQLPPRAVSTVGAQVAAALAAAHELGLVHGDLRPEKVLLGDDGVARVVGLGLTPAGWTDELSDTRIGTGEPAYCSPEVARGGVPDAANDCWALGVTLFRALEAAEPILHTAGMTATLKAIAETPPAPVTAAEGTLADAVDGLLAVDPERRTTAAEAAELLRRARTEAERTEVLPLPRRVGRRNQPIPAAAWAAGLAILGLLGLGAVLLFGGGNDPELDARLDPPKAVGDPAVSPTEALWQPGQSTAVVTLPQTDRPTATPTTTSTTTSTSTPTPTPTPTPTSSTTRPTPTPTRPKPTPTPTTRPQDVPFVGTWSGAVLGDRRPYDATISLASSGSGLAGRVTYTYTDSRGGTCTGTWREISRSGRSVTFAESITSGDCLNGGRMSLTNSIFGKKYSVEYPNVMVWGFLD